jgi:hypothetical protein
MEPVVLFEKDQPVLRPRMIDEDLQRKSFRTSRVIRL